MEEGSDQKVEQGPPSTAEAIPQAELRPFHGAERFEPQYELQQEKAAHRKMCILSAQGLSFREIAEETGYTPVAVAYVLKQPWAREQVIQIQADASNQVRLTLAATAPEAVKMLRKIVNCEVEGTRPADVINASREVLNRMYGAATQFHVHGEVDLDKIPTAELLRIATTT